MEYEGVIFDLDGTLLDTETLSSNCVLHALREVDPNILIEEGIPWSLKKRIIGLPGLEWTQIVIDYACMQDQITSQQLLERWEYYMDLLSHEITLLPGVKETLDYFFAREIPMAIATSSRSNSVEKKLSKFPFIKEKIKEIVCGDDSELRRGKPSPDIFLLAASRLQVDPSRCLVFEDSLSGLMAGRAANMIVIAVPDRRIVEDELDKRKYRQESHFMLNSLEDFDLIHLV